jgi:fatty acid amide hydrolase
MSDIIQLGAAELARRIAAGEISSVAATRACVERIQAVDRRLNAVVVPLFDSALAAAAEANRRQARGESLGPLHGLPVTIKENFHVEGTPSCIGLSRLKDECIATDGVLVDRLRKAGAIVLGKTNLPQLMLWHECDNPVYGRTNNPWDLARTPGGSSGGEGAIIAARGSPLGLAGDLGGSIRVPAHFCGIAGLKPTAYRLPRDGARGNLRGLDSVIGQPGPMARRVEDLALALRVLIGNPLERPQIDVAPAPLLDPAEVPIDRLRIAFWTDDGFFPASPAIQRAVREAADILRRRGAIVEEYRPDFIGEAIEVYSGLMSADLCEGHERSPFALAAARHGDG